MSTRCQVHVIQERGEFSWERLTLYHHWDGYPTNMLPLIASAFKGEAKGWEGVRAGKVASFLCAVDPGQFEPEPGHALHGDIEWYYRLRLSGGQDIRSEARWDVEVFRPKEKGTPDDPGTLVLTAMEVAEAASKAQDFEDAVYGEDDG